MASDTDSDVDSDTGIVTSFLDKGRSAKGAVWCIAKAYVACPLFAIIDINYKSIAAKLS